MMKSLLANTFLTTFIHIHDNTREEWQSYMQMLPPSGKLKMRQNKKVKILKIYCHGPKVCLRRRTKFRRVSQKKIEGSWMRLYSSTFVSTYIGET